MKVLVIEDNEELRGNIVEFLEKENYIVEIADNYHSALEKAIVYNYDCILLDIMLPYGNGLEILRRLNKENKSKNVIIISAKDSLDDKIDGLNLGADDYLTKPFHLAELNARIKAIIRRNNLDGKDKIELGNVCLDINNRQISIKDKHIEFYRKEYDILCYMMMNKNRLVVKTALAEHVWGDHIDEADNFDFIYYQIKNIRKKLTENQASIEIKSVYGTGYKLQEI